MRRTVITGGSHLRHELGALADDDLDDLDDSGRGLDVDEPERFASALVTEAPGLLVIDNADAGGPQAIRVLSALASRSAASATAVLACATNGIGIGPELHVTPLARSDHDILFARLSPAARDALWVGSLGIPGVALMLAAVLDGTPPDADPVVELALRRTSSAEFLDVDVTLVSLLETALHRPTDARTHARLAARLASELFGDTSSAERRQALAAEALRTARADGDGELLAEVLDLRLNALWDVTGPDERLATAADIVELARRVGDGQRERRGLFWRFVALMELGRVATAEATLAAFERAASAVGDADARAVVLARRGTLAAMRGQFDEATRLSDALSTAARRSGLPDADALSRALVISIAIERGRPETLGASIDVLLDHAHRQPGHGYEASAACALAYLGRTDEAGAELQRSLPQALDRAGPRWLRTMAELAIVACATDDTAAAHRLADAMEPRRGHLVIGGGAAVVLGPVDRFLGMLAIQLGEHAAAVSLLEGAAELEASIGALPGLASSLALMAVAEERQPEFDGSATRAAAHRERCAAIVGSLGLGRLLDRFVSPGDEWSLGLFDRRWLLTAAGERVELPEGRGVHVLRTLLANPNHDITALELASGGQGHLVHVDEPVIDDAAVVAYRTRLAALEAELDLADRAGDSARAERAHVERQALLDELRRATGLGGRRRALPAEAERARVNVTRTLRATLARISASAPIVGRHLDASIRTGRSCRYEPAADGPRRWRL